MLNPLITRETMFEPLLAADPSFRPCWLEFLREWNGEPDPPLYLALGSLAEHLLQRLKNKDIEGFDRIFAVVEEWHTAGDVYVSEAASVGFLEAVQNLSGGNDQRVPTIEPWLGPVSRRWWDKLNRFWSGEPKALRFDR
jgi:hypothetical protein